MKVCGGLLLQSGEPLLLQGDLGRLWFETYIQPQPGTPLLLQNGTPLLQQCDIEGALILQFTIPAPTRPTVPPESLKASTYQLGGALVKWDLGPAFAEKNWAKTVEASGFFGFEFILTAEPEVVRAGRAAFTLSPLALVAAPLRTAAAEVTIAHELRIDTAGYTIPHEILEQEREEEEEAAIFRLLG